MPSGAKIVRVLPGMTMSFCRDIELNSVVLLNFVGVSDARSLYNNQRGCRGGEACGSAAIDAADYAVVSLPCSLPCVPRLLSDCGDIMVLSARRLTANQITDAGARIVQAAAKKTGCTVRGVSMRTFVSETLLQANANRDITRHLAKITLFLWRGANVHAPANQPCKDGAKSQANR